MERAVNITHQTHIGDAKGQTDSPYKLTRLKLPEDLTGLSALDIGCNEGFFSDQLAQRNAAQVMGIDIDDRFLAEANRRYARTNVTFKKASWHELPDEKFDVILWTSAMHYERDPSKVLNEISRRLTEKGTLILECGVLQDVGKDMRYVIRHDGAHRYPTVEYLENAIRGAGMTFRLVSHAERVGSDPVPRVVYHCCPQIPSVILIVGASRDGKSTLAGMLRPACSKLISLDWFVSRIADAKWAHTPLHKFIQETIDRDNLGKLYSSLDENNLTDEYVSILADGVANTDEIVVIEGFMTDKQVEQLASKLSERAKVWKIRRM